MRFHQVSVTVFALLAALFVTSAGAQVPPDVEEPISPETAVCKQGNWEPFPGKQQCIDQCDKTSGYPYCHTVHLKVLWWSWETWCLCKDVPQYEPVEPVDPAMSAPSGGPDVPQKCISPDTMQNGQTAAKVPSHSWRSEAIE